MLVGMFSDNVCQACWLTDAPNALACEYTLSGVNRFLRSDSCGELGLSLGIPASIDCTTEVFLGGSLGTSVKPQMKCKRRKGCNVYVISVSESLHTSNCPSNIRNQKWHKKVSRIKYQSSTMI